MNYYSHHIGDYTTDTAHLSLLEDGAYRRLMDRYYTTEAPLPADEAALFRVVRARAPEEQEAVRVVLAEFFDLTDAGWTHKRCDAEISAFKAKSGKAADAANKRWNKPSNANAISVAEHSAMPTQCERIADAMPTNNQEPRTRVEAPHAADAPPTAPKISKAKGCRLTADWKPSQADIAFCKTERPDLRPDDVAAQFRDFWVAKAGADAAKLDWPATWRTWVRKERPGAGGPVNGKPMAKDWE